MVFTPPAYSPSSLPDAASPGRLCPPLCRRRLRGCVAHAIHLSRSFLRYRPPAYRSGRGVPDASLWRLRAGHSIPGGTPTMVVMLPCRRSLAAIAQPPRIMGRLCRWLPCFALLAGARLRSARGREGGGQRCSLPATETTRKLLGSQLLPSRSPPRLQIHLAERVMQPLKLRYL